MCLRVCSTTQGAANPIAVSACHNARLGRKGLSLYRTVYWVFLRRNTQGKQQIGGYAGELGAEELDKSKTGVLRERACPKRQRQRPEPPPALRQSVSQSVISRSRPALNPPPARSPAPHKQRRTSRRATTQGPPSGIHTTNSSSGLRMCIWPDLQGLCGLGFEEASYWKSKFSSSSFETVPATNLPVCIGRATPSARNRAEGASPRSLPGSRKPDT